VTVIPEPGIGKLEGVKINPLPPPPPEPLFLTKIERAAVPPPPPATTKTTAVPSPEEVYVPFPVNDVVTVPR
tara:strand:- start:320 stop:535 length:216 start_codon:yes stop_codon:yes gene_type:complete